MVRILIVGPAWVGDMVMAQSLFAVLHTQYPDMKLDVLAPDWTRPLLDRMPEVSEALVMPLGHGSLGLGERRRLGVSLREKAYDQAYVLPNSLKSALVPWFAKIPKRIGWRGEMRIGLLNDCRKLDKEKYPQMVERFVALAYPEGTDVPDCPAPRLDTGSDNLPGLLERLNLRRDKQVLVCCPGAEYGPSKQWPARYFAELAMSHAGEGQVWLVGSERDNDIAREIISASGGHEDIHDLTGKTSLGEVIDLMSLADSVVTNDSGLMHIAAALALPLVAVYGSTSPDFTPPLGKSVKILTPDIECSPCFQRECPLQHHNCMEQMSVDRVNAALAELGNK